MVSQDQIEIAREQLRILGNQFYGEALTERLMSAQPMSLIRIMCEDAIHDWWHPLQVEALRNVLRVFRAAQV